MYDKVCPKCNYNLSYYYKTGMLGCPHCYHAFEAEIIETLKEIQGGTKHLGKVPSLGYEKELLSEYKRLLGEKERAIMEGRFADINRISSTLYELAEELKKKGLI